MRNTIIFKARLPLKYTKRKNWVLASCPPLDIHSQGKNKTEAKNNLTEAVSLFFISCFERGTLDAALKSCGFIPAKHLLPITKTKQISKKDSISVPIPFHISKSGHAACHA